MEKVFSNVILTYTASGLGFVVMILAARLLGAEQYTWVALGLALGGFIVPIAGLGSQSIFIRDAVAADSIIKIRKIIVTSFSMRVTGTVLASLLVLAGSLFFTSNPVEIIALTCFTIWNGLQGLYPTSWYDYSHDTKSQNWLVLFERTIAAFIVASLFLLEREQLSAAALLGVLLLASRVFFITYQVKKWWRANGSGKFNMQFVLPIRAYDGISFKITLTLLANAVLTYGNQLLLADSNSSDLSAYSLSLQIITLIFLFQTLIIRIQSRSIAEAITSGHRIAKAFLIHSSATTAGSAILGGGAFILTVYLPRFLADPSYLQMQHYMPVLWLWITIVGTGQVVTQYLVTLHKENFYFYTGIIGGITACGLGLIYVPHYGAYAVAIILLAVHGSMILVSLLKLIFTIYFGDYRVERRDNNST